MMNRNYFIWLLGYALLLMPSTGFPQCDAAQYAEESVQKLPPQFTFLKSFKIDGHSGQRQKVEYSYVFSKDTNYAINLATGGEESDGIVINMYDAKRQKVATNSLNGKIYGGLQYPCKATGIYYITFTFENSTNFCGGSVLGFKR